MTHELQRGWAVHSLGFALGEPVVDLVRVTTVRAGASHSAPTTGGRIRLPLMDVVASERPPDGFIFHLPRSGSTLVARLLATTRHCVALLEPPGINALLSARGVSAVQRTLWLRRLLSLYVAPGHADGHRVVVKLSSWMTLFFESFEAAWPGVPSCFLVRHPVEVLVQVLSREPGWMADHARAIVGEEEAPAASPERRAAYGVQVLRRFCEAVIGLPARPLILHYDDLPHCVVSGLAPHFGLVLSAADRDAIETEARIDAKEPDRRAFEPDGQRLRARATPALRQLANRELAPVIDALS